MSSAEKKKILKSEIQICIWQLLLKYMFMTRLSFEIILQNHSVHCWDAEYCARVQEALMQNRIYSV